MKTYDKRIAFMISSQHLIPHGGIGQFAKGFLEMCEDLGWAVDLILDKVPENSGFTDYMNSKSCKLVFPESPLSYSEHSKTYAFSESYNLEKMINFRTSIMNAFQSNIYDLILINTPEAVPAVYGLNIADKIPVVFYTHNQSLLFMDNKTKTVFSKAFGDFYKKILNLPYLILATQTKRNASELVDAGYKNVCNLPMSIPERGLLESSKDQEKNGVLFIGRWEPNKNPKEYIRVIEETGLPAKVMTSRTSAKKFEKALKDIGAEYDIRSSIIGDEKVEFIKSSKVFYMPSLLETYGFAMLECLGHMPCVMLDTVDWNENFKDSKVHIFSKDSVASGIKKLYNENNKDDLDFVVETNNRVANRWSKFLNKINMNKKPSTSSVISKKDDLYYSDHIDDLNRFASSEDIISVINSKTLFDVTYTKNDTWLSKNGSEPKEKDEGILGWLS